MFLSKENAGEYHLFYFDETGKRRSRSTGARTKADAVRFLRSSNADEYLKRRAIKHIKVEQFRVAYLSYTQSVNTPKTVESNRSALDELSRIFGSTCVIGKITPAVADGSTVRLRAERANHVWGNDFVAERTSDGKAFRMLNIIDEFTRECLVIHVTMRITAYDVLEQLAELYIMRGTPDFIRSGNGPEFVADVERGPIFDTVLEARVITERWRGYYNTIRPHSALGRPPVPESYKFLQLANG